jgi:hypothetical protein
MKVVLQSVIDYTIKYKKRLTIFYFKLKLVIGNWSLVII